ncbi:hypothetical protein [Herbiconiux liukaitaii]|uniref:hypothetical protein n=1 Tax=Herbiconiux liukaitaii TaxID=3342799 RepID=UPI0035B7C141
MQGATSRSFAGWRTAALLQCAAIGALTAVVIAALSPITSSLALISPVVYAFLASVNFLGPLVAARWVREPGALLLTAVIAGVLAIPFTPLGFLVLFALGLPALVGELVLVAGRFYDGGRRAVWYAAALCLAVTLFAISLVVIDPSLISPWLVALTLVGRLTSLTVLAWFATAVERALTRAGLRRHPVGTRGRTAGDA